MKELEKERKKIRNTMGQVRSLGGRKDLNLENPVGDFAQFWRRVREVNSRKLF